MFGVLGPNGAGKTTMLKMLATLLPIDGGLARVFGVDVAAHPHQVRQLVGVTGQYASVDENLTGRENLVLFGRLLGLSRAEARATADELLASFGLTDAADRQIKTFSGGMRRRLDLAASLISRPPLIFLDEPTTGLDPRTRGQMWDTIRELVRDGATVLLTTQYLDEADQLADRIAVIDRGAKVAEGTPDELKASVGNSTLYVRLEDRDRTAEAAALVTRVLGEEPVLTPEAGGLNIALADANRAADVLIALREAKLGISTATVRQPTLDEVFLALTGHHSERRRREAEECADGDPAVGSAAWTPARRTSTLRETVAQTLAMAWRALMKMRRNPEQFFDVTLQPLLFTAMFTYIFGGAIAGRRAELPADHHPRHPGADRRSPPAWRPASSCARTWTRACSIASSRCRSPASRRSPARRSPTCCATAIAATLTILVGFVMGYRPGGGFGGVAGRLGADRHRRAGRWRGSSRGSGRSRAARRPCRASR